MKYSKILTLLFISFFITSCSETEVVKESADVDISSTTNELVNSDKVKSEELNLAIRPIKSFNPLINTDEHNREILALIYEDLFFYDENMKNTSNIVNTPVFSEDGKSITLTVKDGVKWHNGILVKPDDIVYSITTLMNNQNPLFLNSIQNITSAKVVGGNVVINFNKVFNIDTLDLSIPVVQRGFYKNTSEYDYDNLKTNGTGKFKLVEIKDSRNFVLKILDRYSEEASVDRINLIVIENFQMEINAFNADIIDVIYMNPEELANIKNGETTTIANVLTNEYEFIAFNFKNPLLNDVTIRQALANAVPTDETIRSMFLNSGDRAQSNINPNSYLYNDSLIKYTENFEKSKELLASIGYNTLTQDGLIEKVTDTTSITLDFTILVNEDNVHRTNLAKKYAENLKAIGVKSTVLAVPFEEYIARLEEGRYDIAFVGYLTPKGQNNISLFSEQNILNYTNSKIPELAEKLRNATNSKEYQEAINSLQNIVNNDLPVISICYNNELLISNDDVSNIDIVFDNYLYNIDSWQVLKNKGIYEH